MKRILVIDDDPQVRMMLRMTFEDAGFEVLEASDGEAGVKQFRSSPTEIVITDLVMPGKEGIETIVEIKQVFPEAKVVAISGGGKLGPDNYLKIAAECGAEHVFSKPIDRARLVACVCALTQGDLP